mgnify:CR=1 FL=1
MLPVPKFVNEPKSIHDDTEPVIDSDDELDMGADDDAIDLGEDGSILGKDEDYHDVNDDPDPNDESEDYHDDSEKPDDVSDESEDEQPLTNDEPVPDDNVNDESSADEESVPDDDKDDKKNAPSPRSKARAFLSKVRSEIGDDPSSSTAKDGDDGGKSEPSVNAGMRMQPLSFLLSLPTRIVGTLLGRLSLIMLIIIIWAIPNVMAAVMSTSTSQAVDEGTISISKISYSHGTLSFRGTNKSDMIAHVNVSSVIKAWKPSLSNPKSIIMPVQVMTCQSVSKDVNPGVAETFTTSCTGDTGIWMRPKLTVENR